MTYIAKTEEKTYNTERRHQFITISKDVQDFVTASGVKDGSVIVQTHHTTCRVWVNEDEKNLVGKKGMEYTSDIHRVMDRFASPDEDYHHDDVCDVNNPKGKRNTHLCEADSCGVIDECRNGHSHAQALLLPHAVSLIVSNGKVILGRWQEIMLVELDHDRERKVTFLAQGSA